MEDKELVRLLEEAIYRIMDEPGTYSRANEVRVKVTRDQPHIMTINVLSMYEYVTVNVQTFMALSKVLGTEAIDIVGKECLDGGCDTCEYGSEYEVKFVAYDAEV